MNKTIGTNGATRRNGTDIATTTSNTASEFVTVLQNKIDTPIDNRGRPYQPVTKKRHSFR